MQAEKGINALNDPNDEFTRVFAASAQMLGEIVNKAKNTSNRK
jgi:hypothetical protein